MYRRSLAHATMGNGCYFVGLSTDSLPFSIQLLPFLGAETFVGSTGDFLVESHDHMIRDHVYDVISGITCVVIS